MTRKPLARARKRVAPQAGWRGRDCDELRRRQEGERLAAARRAVVGERAGRPNDPVMASCPIDVMAARGVISMEAREAARWLDVVWRSRFGSVAPKGSHPDGMPCDDAPLGGDSEWREAQYWVFLGHPLLTVDQRVALVNVAVYQQSPRWLDALVSGMPLADVDARHRDGFVDASAALVRAWIDIGKLRGKRLMDAADAVKRRAVARSSGNRRAAAVV